MIHQLNDTFQIPFNMIRLPYSQLDEILTYENFITSGDKVNVFINVESIMKFLSMIVDLEGKLINEKRKKEGFAREFINTVAHYRSFFRRNNMEVRICLYMSGLDNQTFNESKYNEYYRLYYNMKYTTNPKFIYMTELLTKQVFPMVQKVLEFVNQSYFLMGNGIEGSLIPLIVQSLDPSYKSIVIGSDPVETQYRFYKNFYSIYIKQYHGRKVFYKIEDFIKEFTKDDDFVQVVGNPILTNRSLYNTLLAVSVGDNIRNIDRIHGVGYKTFLKYLLEGYKKNTIQKTTTNIDLISAIFPDNMKEEVINNFYCVDMTHQYRDLTEADRLSITHQMIDRFDNNSFMRINKEIFEEVGPINTEALLL